VSRCPTPRVSLLSLDRHHVQHHGPLVHYLILRRSVYDTQDPALPQSDEERALWFEQVVRASLPAAEGDPVEPSQTLVQLGEMLRW
jgi:hypothetical protein